MDQNLYTKILTRHFITTIKKFSPISHDLNTAGRSAKPIRLHINRFFFQPNKLLNRKKIQIKTFHCEQLTTDK